MKNSIKCKLRDLARKALYFARKDQSLAVQASLPCAPSTRACGQGFLPCPRSSEPCRDSSPWRRSSRKLRCGTHRADERRSKACPNSKGACASSKMPRARGSRAGDATTIRCSSGKGDLRTHCQRPTAVAPGQLASRPAPTSGHQCSIEPTAACHSALGAPLERGLIGPHGCRQALGRVGCAQFMATREVEESRCRKAVSVASGHDSPLSSRGRTGIRGVLAGSGRLGRSSRPT